MNTTTEILTVNGVVLNTLAKNIESIAGRLHVAGKKGSNQDVAGMHGELWVPGKKNEANTIALPMWVRGTDDDGVVPSAGQDRINFFKNLDQLTRIFGRSALLDVRHTLPDGSIRKCLAEVLTAIDFSVSGGARPLGRFGVELNVPAAFWQDLATVQQNVATLVPGTNYHYNALDGSTAPITDAVYTLTGPANAGLSVTDVQSGNSFTLNQAIPAGQTAVIDSGNWTVTVNGVDALTNLSHTGDFFLEAEPTDTGEMWFRVAGSGFTAATALNVSMLRKFRVG